MRVEPILMSEINLNATKIIRRHVNRPYPIDPDLGLVEDITKNGLQKPIAVASTPAGYVIIDGVRRIRAISYIDDPTTIEIMAEIWDDLNMKQVITASRLLP